MPTLKEKLKEVEKRMNEKDKEAMQKVSFDPPVEVKPGESAVIEGDKATVEKPNAKPKREPKQDQPRVKYTCGHAETIAFLQSHPCIACVNRARNEKAKANLERIRGQKQAQSGKNDDKRLPEGSKFEVEYHAESKTWSGWLHVPGYDFHNTSGGVFRLLGDLDAMYRKWKANKEKSC